MMPAPRRIGIVLVPLSLLALALLTRREHRAPPRGGSGAPASGCALCHDIAAEGPAGLHASFPCESCHLGDPEGTTVLAAHDGLELETGALDVVDRTCGLCHEREVSRVRTSPMATARGLLAVDRWAFGETPAPDGDQTLEQLLDEADPTPAQDHLRRLCAGCHLNARRNNRDDAIPEREGSGCSACHTGPGTGDGHSTIQGEVPDGRCFGCHSRSARISLTYQGLAEVSGPPAEACGDTATLHDGRTVCRIEPDVHQAAGMGCTDCHLYTELMGDGKAYRHQEDAVEISCEACHGPVAPGGRTSETTWSSVTDSIIGALLRVNIQWRPGEERLRLGRLGTPLWNLRPPADRAAPWLAETWVLTSKATGRPMPVTPTPRDMAHTLFGHERLSCSSCHAAAAPTCPTCHTTFEADSEQWDFGIADVAAGRWVESNEGMGFDVPRLAIGADGRIRPAIPGMDATLDARQAGGRLREVHLFSVLDPHSTTRSARTCASCHLDRGAFAGGEGTRIGARSLDADELDRVARVGPCLECHDGTEAWFDSFALLVEGLDAQHPAELEGRRPPATER